MSASSKKKLRNAQEAEKLTEKQLAEQKEAKKLKIYTIIFVVVLVLMIIVAAYTAISSAVRRSGVMQRSTVALTINDHELSNAELNYFYMDEVQEFLRQFGGYASMFGLDLTKPLDTQVYDPESGDTWADNFLDSAIANAKSVYALCDEAAAQGYTLDEEQTAYVDSIMSSLEETAKENNFTKVEDYLKAMYGFGATKEGVRQYLEKTHLAYCYQTEYSNSLTYDDAAIQEESKANFATYCNYNLNYCYLSADRFLEGGVEGEDGKMTYSDEEKAAAVAAAEAAAKSLAEGNYADAAAFDAAIAALPINAGSETPTASTALTDVAYKSVPAAFRDWAADSARKSGDYTYVANTSTSGEEGSETTTVNGYYVARYESVNDNEYPLVNVRHILVSFQGGTKDANGNTTYSDEEKAAAKTEAESILESWKNGKASEETFAALAKEKSTDTGSSENGGLYEDVYPGQMVTNFNDWCFEQGRKAGDTGIVESPYGYHVMYYVGGSETSYRDFLITNALRTAAANEWYNNLLDNAVVTEKNTKYVSTDLILSNG